MAESYFNKKGVSRLHLRSPGMSSFNFWDVLNRVLRWLIVAFLLALSILFFLPVLKNVQRFEHSYNAKKDELVREEGRQRKLKQEVDLLRTDPEFNERIAREKLGWAKQNEVIFRFPPLPKQDYRQVSGAATASLDRSK